MRRRTLCAPSWSVTKPKSPILTIEDYENQGYPQRAFDAREADGGRRFVNSSDEEKESAGRAHVLQRRGRGRVGELVKMAECVPVEIKRLSAFETTSVTWRVFAASVREFCDWSGLLADSNVEALEVDRLDHGVHELAFFSEPPGLEGRKIVGKRPLLLSTFLAAGGGSTWVYVYRCRSGAQAAAPPTL